MSKSKLSKKALHAIMKKARAAQLRTMATKAYQRAKEGGSRTLNAWRRANAAS